MSKKKKYTTWLLSWDMFGLECAINVDYYEQGHKDHEKNAIWETLKGNTVKETDPGETFSRILHRVLLRARINSQRHYEVYTVTIPSNITEDQIHEMFKNNAQSMADLVREKGTQHFSARLATGKAVIQ